jgi:hypothetical protein
LVNTVAPLLLSICVGILAKATLASYLLVCLPVSLSVCELLNIPYQFYRPRISRNVSIPVSVEQKKSLVVV